MKKEEVVRLVDSIHRDKNISRSILFDGLRFALEQAASKAFEVEPEEVKASVNQISGDIAVFVNGEKVDMNSGELGRIAAQTTKQFFKAKILEAEKDIVMREFSDKIRTIISCEVLRRERGNIVVQVLGYGCEAIIPREEQVPTERYRTGDRIRCLILGIQSKSSKANLVLSRSRPELVHELFMADVPEIADDVIVVMELAREAGFRTKIAVHCEDSRIDCVGACVGPRGTRIRNIINELGGEKIDIIPWADVQETFIANSLAPARISRVYVNRDDREAIVVVPDDQLSLAIGKKGQNVRLTCRLTRWNVEVKSETEFESDENGDSPEEGEEKEGVEVSSDAEAVAPVDGDNSVAPEETSSDADQPNPESEASADATSSEPEEAEASSEEEASEESKA
jgi:transcription termination/antitermination protein NusA